MPITAVASAHQHRELQGAPQRRRRSRPPARPGPTPSVRARQTTYAAGSANTTATATADDTQPGRAAPPRSTRRRPLRRAARPQPSRPASRISSRVDSRSPPSWSRSMPSAPTNSIGGSTSAGCDAGGERVLEGLLGEVALRFLVQQEADELRPPRRGGRSPRGPTPAVTMTRLPMSSGGEVVVAALEVRVLGQRLEDVVVVDEADVDLAATDGRDDGVVVGVGEGVVGGDALEPLPGRLVAELEAHGRHEVLERGVGRARRRGGPSTRGSVRSRTLVGQLGLADARRGCRRAPACGPRSPPSCRRAARSCSGTRSSTSSGRVPSRPC